MIADLPPHGTDDEYKTRWGLAFPNTIQLLGANDAATEIKLYSDGRIEGDIDAVQEWLATATLLNQQTHLLLVWLLLKELRR